MACCVVSKVAECKVHSCDVQHISLEVLALDVAGHLFGDDGHCETQKSEDLAHPENSTETV